MAKRLKLVVPTEITVRDIDMEVLDMVDKLSRRPGAPVSLTYRELADELGKSQRTAFRAVESCLERGFLSADSAFL